MLAFISIIIILASILLIAVVFIQNPKGGGLSSDFGAQQLGGVQRTNDFVEKATWVLAGVIMIGAISMSSLMEKKEVIQTPQTNGQTQGQGAPNGNAPAPGQSGGQGGAPAAQ